MYSGVALLSPIRSFREDCSGTRLLLVEDNAADVRLFQCALREVKDWLVDLTVAADGDAAIAAIQESCTANRPFDLVVLDLNMPRRSGSEVLRWIRTASPIPAVPAVILSSDPQDRALQAVRAEGINVDGCFEKPGDFDEFVALLSEIRVTEAGSDRPVAERETKKALLGAGASREHQTRRKLAGSENRAPKDRKRKIHARS